MVDKSSNTVANVVVTDTMLKVTLNNGRKVNAPLGWFPKLAAASAEQRKIWEPSAAGHGIHWPRIDEDLSVEGLLRGQQPPQF